MYQKPFDLARNGDAVVVSETGVEPFQLAGRIGATTFLVGGRQIGHEMRSGLDPYTLLSAALASCTAMTLRSLAIRHSFQLGRLHVAVTHRHGEKGGPDSFERIVYLDDVPEEYREALVSAAETCPVGQVLGAGSDMRTIVVVDGIAAHTVPADARAASDYWQEYLSGSGDIEDDPRFKYG